MYGSSYAAIGSDKQWYFSNWNWNWNNSYHSVFYQCIQLSYIETELLAKTYRGWRSSNFWN